MDVEQGSSRNQWAESALSGLLDEGADDMCDEAGPPTEEDSAWFQHHVVSRGYPRLKREPKQLPGQMKLDEKREHILSTYRRDKLFAPCWCGVIHATGLTEDNA